MNHLTVNGVERAVPLTNDQSVRSLVDYIRTNYNTDSSLVASIRINGIEMTEQEEVSMGELALADLDRVEIYTAHPREFADETLRYLQEYTQHLETLSKQAASQVSEPEFAITFDRLIDDIEVFTDGIQTVRQILRANAIAEINVVEVDLISILKDILNFRESHSDAYVAELLHEHLPVNLTQWREYAIPLLMRARDS